MNPPVSRFAVPPTVRRSILIVGMPTPTGTACPSLPQVPTPSSSFKSLPTIETRVSTSGPLPIRVAPLIGAVICPFSMRYASDAEKTNLPFVMSTCPPPKLTAYTPFFTERIMSSGIVLPGQHVSVRHARHRNVLVAFAASVAGIGEAHQLRREFVAEISLQNSILDQHGFLRGLAFIIDVQRAAAPRHGAVIDHGALFAGHSFADQAGECRRLLAIEVGLQPVTDRLVQQNAGPSRTEHYFHVAGRSFARVELQNCLPRGLFGKELRSLLTRPKKKSSATRPPPPDVPRPSWRRSSRCRKHSCAPAAASLPQRCRRSRPPEWSSIRRHSWRALP